MSFLQTIEPTRFEIAGKKTAVFFSMRAAAKMEDILEIPYPEIVQRLVNVSEMNLGDDILTLSEQKVVLACLLQEGQRKTGEDVQELEAIIEMVEGMHMKDFTELAVNCSNEIFKKSPKKEKDEKNS